MSALLADYDAGVFEADRGVGQVLDQLAATGRLDHALVIVTSDHGESFGEQGIHVGHGLNLTDDELRIPLVVHLPAARGAGTRLPQLVDLTSIMPTVLDVMGVAAPPEMQGQSLLPLLDGKPPRRDFEFGLSQNKNACFLVRDGSKIISAPVISPMEIALRHLAPVSPPAAGRDPGEVYHRGREQEARGPYDMDGDPLGLRDVIADSPRLYRRADDPGEQHDLFAVDRARADRMAGELLTLYMQSLALAETLDDGETESAVDAHQDQALKQLGYFSASDPVDQQELLNALPRSMREPLQHPYHAPDTTLLLEADRDAHRVRLELAEGRVDGLPAQQILRSCAERYARWLSEHPEQLARVAWRIDALATIATDAGLDVDVQRWRRLLGEVKYRAEHPEAGDQASPPPIETGPTDAPDGDG
jgi:hypothetical protein